MVKSIEALARGIQVVEILRDHPTTTLAQLHQQTGISKATLLRILRTLQETGWVYRTPDRNNYRLSHRLFTEDRPEIYEQKLAEIALLAIEEMLDQIPGAVDVAIRDDMSMKVIESTRPRMEILRADNVIGRQPPLLFSGIGRAYLGFCSEEERKRVIARLREKNDKEGRLARDGLWVDQLVQDVRRKGYALRESEYFGVATPCGKKLEAMAVPVLHKNQFIGTVSLVWPRGSTAPQNLEQQVYPVLKDLSVNIAQAL